MTSNKKVPLWRQHTMRVLFFLNVISLGPDHWAVVLFPNGQADAMTGVAISFYAALALWCVFGIRFPLKFTPLLLLQLVYKLAWLAGTYWPAQRSGLLTESLTGWFWVMAPGVALDVLVIPWGYVYREYLKQFFRLKKHPAEAASQA